MKTRFTPSARLAFLKAIGRIRQESPSAALNFRQRVESSLRRLERFPESAPRIAEFPDLPYRELYVAPYRFFYRTENQVVWIVEVWHEAQIPDKPTGTTPG
jgi:plasmid stabilization system protein ParE